MTKQAFVIALLCVFALSFLMLENSMVSRDLDVKQLTDTKANILLQGRQQLRHGVASPSEDSLPPAIPRQGAPTAGEHQGLAQPQGDAVIVETGGRAATVASFVAGMPKHMVLFYHGARAACNIQSLKNRLLALVSNGSPQKQDPAPSPESDPTVPEHQRVTSLSEEFYLGAAIYLAFVILIGVIYSSCGFRQQALPQGATSQLPEFNTGPTEDFHFGLFDYDGCCGRDQRMCLCSCFCGVFRWADTLSQEKLKFGVSFWALVLFCTATDILAYIDFGITSVLVLIAAVAFRQKLRTALGLKSATCGTYVKDILVWGCCAPCATMQEAREVEYFPVMMD